MRQMKCANGHFYDADRYPNGCPHCGNGAEKETRKGREPITISFHSGGIDPVVGWLLCVGGGKSGKDYRLKAGKNFIGRSDEMDVCLEDEPTVSKNRYACIIYEPRQNIFFVQPGDTKGLVYLNDQALLMPSPMKKNDVLKIGELSLMLIPGCDDSFKWEDANKE